MSKSRLFLGLLFPTIRASFIFISFAMLFVSSGCAKGEYAAEVIFIENGHTTNLTRLVGITNLVAACENSLVTAVGMTRLGVANSTISGIKHEATSIEIIYSHPKEIVIASFGKKIVVDRIIIPLSGEFAEAGNNEKFVMVFYGNGKYESGPFTNSEKMHIQIVGALSKLGIKLKSSLN